jgi:hypothetical protein
MADHVLLELAVRTPHKEVPDLPEGAHYDVHSGFWVLNGRPLVVECPIFSGPVTKKADQETGEDRKGE